VATFKRQIPKRHHGDLEMLGAKMYSAITGYVNGNLATSAVAGVAAGIMSTIVGLPYPALLGLIIAFTDLIPMVGATIGAVVVVIIAMFSSITDAAVMAVFFALYQQLENYVIVPRIMGKTVEMSSFVVFIAALSGGILAGFVGALVAIPVGACLQILAKYALEKSFFRH
jgi:predicted PurR-regulated permease PerM